MAKLKHTSVSIIMTMISVMLILLSLSFPWYTVRLTHISATSTWEFYLDYLTRYSTMGDVYPGLAVYDYVIIGFHDVGTLMTITMLTIGLWAFFSLVYVWSLLGGAPAFRRGWGMLVIASLPPFMFALFIQGAVKAEFEHAGTIYNSADWILSSGWILAFTAWLSQTAGLMLRQLQLLSPDSRRRSRVVQRQQEDTSD